jgi:hypothetical protein
MPRPQSVGMRWYATKQSARVTLFKNLESVATAPQLLEEIRKRRIGASWPLQQFHVRMTQPVPEVALTGPPGGMRMSQSLKHQ